MKRVLSMALCAVAAAALLTGCEWSSSSEYNESWNESFNWVNFSGTYRSTSGDMLVTDYTMPTNTPGKTNNFNTTESGGILPAGGTAGSGSTKKKPLIPGSFSLVIGDVMLADNSAGALEGTGGSGSVSYSAGTWSFKLEKGSTATYETVSTSESGGVLKGDKMSAKGSTGHKPIVAGSLQISVGDDVTFSDDGNGGLSGGGSGKVSYDGGTWSFELADKYWSASDRSISVSYAYEKKISDEGEDREIIVRYGYEDSTEGVTGTVKSGSTGKAIYALVVAQQGQNLTITDNNGAKYTGRITKLQSISGVNPTNSLPRDLDTIYASFSTQGTSAAGKKVTIAGTFQGTVKNSVFTDRTMQATWVESGGKTGDIRGTTGAISIDYSVSTTQLGSGTNQVTSATASASTGGSSSSGSTSGSTTTAE